MDDRYATLALDYLDIIENTLRIHRFNLERATSSLLLAANETDAFDHYQAKGVRSEFKLLFPILEYRISVPREESKSPREGSGF